MLDIEINKNFHTVQRMPPSIRGTIFEYILEVISEELADWKNEIIYRNNALYDIDLMTKEELILFTSRLAFSVSTIANSDINFLREEIRNIPFKIANKGTPLLYKSLISSIGRKGEIFLYIYKEGINNIIRLPKLPYNNAILTHPSLPFRQSFLNNFSGNINTWINLDNEEELMTLDSTNNIWNLDEKLTDLTTNHIGLELFIDRIIERDGVDFLMTKNNFIFLSNELNLFRRVKEVIHVGTQIGIQIDDSGLSNPLAFKYKNCEEGNNTNICLKCEYNENYCYYKNGNINSEYTLPSLKLKAVAHPDYFIKTLSSNDILLAEFGIGEQAVASTENTNVSFPVNLAKRVFTASITNFNRFENKDYRGAVAEYAGQSLNNLEVDMLEGDFDNENQDFRFKLPYAPIQKNNVTLAIYFPDETVYLVTDEESGKLQSSIAQGQINYATGECSLTTKFDYLKKEIIHIETFLNHDPTLGRTYFNYTFSAATTNIIPGSVWIIFSIKKDGIIYTFAVNDDGNGRFYHEFIDSQINTINYTTRTLTIQFTVPLVGENEKDFICKYSFHIDVTLSAGTRIEALHFFTQNTINITEIGFRNTAGELISYATFPPIEFISSAYHLDFMLLVHKNKVE